LSHGYKMLEKNMLEQKIKACSTSIEEENSVYSLKSPSTPSGHEKRKSACLKPSRTWTSEESQRTTERIVRNMLFMCYFKFNVC